VETKRRTFFLLSFFLFFLALLDSELGVELAGVLPPAAGLVGVTGLTGVVSATVGAGAGAGAGVGLALPNDEMPEKSNRSAGAELATIVEIDEVEDEVDDDDDEEEVVLAEASAGMREGNLKGMSKLSSYCRSSSLLSSSSSSRFRLTGFSS
jgi:hypothetical protein